jgi:hypothetical protein
MVIIGMVGVWAAYTVGIWGYCLVKGYDVTFPSLFKTTWTSAAQSPASATTPGGPVPDPGTGTFLA